MTELVTEERLKAMAGDWWRGAERRTDRERLAFLDGGRAVLKELRVAEVIEVGPECEPEHGPLCPFVRATICSRVNCEDGAVLIRARKEEK